MKQSKYSLLNTADEKLGWAAERMMGMQEDADVTPEIIADYAWLRDDEIEGECVEMWPFLIGQEGAEEAQAAGVPRIMSYSTFGQIVGSARLLKKTIDELQNQ